jgi:hypothetical protein
LEKDIVKSLELLGEERAVKLFSSCSWFDEQEEEMEELLEEKDDLEEELESLNEEGSTDDESEDPPWC